MAWEVEYEHVDKAEGVHRYGLIERSVIGRDGQPARAKYYTMLGNGADGTSCPHCLQPVNSSLVLQSDGVLQHPEGEHIPHEKVREHIAKLNDFHARMDAYAKRHNATIYKGPAK